MRFSRLLFLIASLLSPLALLSTTWLYLYPLFHGCGFPVPSPNPETSAPLSRAPFRLLALGDPQLEGDSSLPPPGTPSFPSLNTLRWEVRELSIWHAARHAIQAFTSHPSAARLRKRVYRDLSRFLAVQRKKLDLWGNDLYLAHVVRQTRWWTEPTHVAVLGDLLGSQWISDQEFEERSRRFWDVVFKGLERVPEGIMGGAVVAVGDEEEGEAGVAQESEGQDGERWGGVREVLGGDRAWARRVINIAGNHDIGYAGDLDEGRMARFERAFGKANWELVFELPRANGTDTEADSSIPPALRLVILNSMNLDTPALSPSLQEETYDFLNHIITTSQPVTDKTHATILLTHIPLHKKAGTCVDSPFFDFFPGSEGGGVREQNMLSPHSSRMILEGIFGLHASPDVAGQGMGRRGIIVNGHDHEGCDTLHYVADPKRHCDSPQPTDLTHEAHTSENDKAPNDASADLDWDALRLPSQSMPLSFAKPNYTTPSNECISHALTPHMREVTLRSMMGEFFGSAGFLSAWFDATLGERGEWRIEVATCEAGVQHLWWAVHGVDVVVVVLLALAGVVWGVEGVGGVLGMLFGGKVTADGRGKADGGRGAGGKTAGEKTGVVDVDGRGGVKTHSTGGGGKRELGRESTR